MLEPPAHADSGALLRPAAPAGRACSVATAALVSASLILVAFLNYPAGRNTEPHVPSALQDARGEPLPPPSELRNAQGESLQVGGAPLARAGCAEIRSIIESDGVGAVADRISMFQTHLVGQLTADVALQRGLPLAPVFREASVRGMRGYLKYGPIGYGFWHGAIWFVVGTSEGDVDWTQLRTELCTNATYEYISMCMHGLGHAGFVKAARPYNACSSVHHIPTNELVPAYHDVCATAPSSVLELLCANGYYHGVNEKYDPAAAAVAGKSWMYPCDADDVPYQEVCFRWQFFQVPLSLMPGLPFQGFPARRVAFEQSGNLDVCLSLASEDLVRKCIWGLSSVAGPGFFPEYYLPLWHAYYRQFAPELAGSASPLVDWCARWIDREALGSTDRPLFVRDLRRWLACIGGTLSFIMAETWRTRKVHVSQREELCLPLLAVEWQSDSTRALGYKLCLQSTRFNYFSSPTTDSRRVDDLGIWFSSRPAQWADWLNASVRSERYAMWPLHPSHAADRLFNDE